MNIKTNLFRGFVEEQMQGVPQLRFHRMFGGFGIYSGEVFFGLISKEKLYFRTNDQTKTRYEDAGMTFFVAPGSKKALKKYYEVPPSVLERKSELLNWAREAIASALLR